MENYTFKDYMMDRDGPEIRHTESKERFEAFYEQLGHQDVQKTQRFQHWRMSVFEPLIKGKIIELGCHIGFNLIYYAKKGHSVVGVEIAQSLLDIAQESIDKETVEVQKKIKLKKAWIEDLVVDEKYDTVILTEVLEHVLEPLPVLKKAVEFMKDDGIMCISAPSQRDGSNSHVRGVPVDYMKELLNETNLEVIKWHSLVRQTALTVKKK